MASDDGEKTMELIVGAFGLIAVIIWISYLYAVNEKVSRWSRYFPHSAAMITLGIVVGALLDLSGLNIDAAFDFDHSLFFHVFLPPIIFAAGFSVRKDYFFNNLGTITLLAFVGTLVTSFFLGSMIHWIGPHSMDFVDAMILGSLLSAIDPVATISVLKSMNVDMNLYVIIFGEAVLNDAVAIVVNRVFVDLRVEGKTTFDLLPVLGQFLWASVGSIVIGTSIGLLAAYVHKHSKLHRANSLELALFIVGAFAPYFVAELADMSGIMAVLFAGIVADHYTHYNLSTRGAHATHYFAETMEFVSESFVFAFVGMAVFTHEGHVFKGTFIALIVLWCLIGRALSVVPLTLLINWRRAPADRIPAKHVFLMWFAGLRGPIAFALAFAVPAQVDVIVTTTLSVVLLTTFVMGSASWSVARALGIAKDGPPPAHSEEEQYGESLLDEDNPNMYATSSHWFNVLDRDYLRRTFRIDARTAEREGRGTQSSDHVVQDRPAPRAPTMLGDGFAMEEMRPAPGAEDDDDVSYAAPASGFGR